MRTAAPLLVMIAFAVAAGGCASSNGAVSSSSSSTAAPPSQAQPPPGGYPAQTVAPGRSNPGGAAAVAPCANGTAATYVGTTCSQNSTVFTFKGYSCTSSPSSLCDSLGTDGADVNMVMDPNGNNTILVGRTSNWNVSAGQSIDVVISGSLYGATANGNWPHFNQHRGGTLVGFTGDGSEENITSVDCTSRHTCLDSNNGVSDIPCNASTPLSNCTDEQSVVPYAKYTATFAPSAASDPYQFTIEIKLSGGAGGSASIYSVGVHIGNRPR